MTKKISRYYLSAGKLLEADDGEWVRYVDVARFLPGYDRGREHPDTWPAAEPSVAPELLAPSGEDPAMREAAESIKELIDSQHEMPANAKAVLYGNLDRLYLR